MTSQEKQGLEKLIGEFEIIAEYSDEQNVFDFAVVEGIDGELYYFNLASWEFLESLDTSELIEK